MPGSRGQAVRVAFGLKIEVAVADETLKKSAENEALGEIAKRALEDGTAPVAAKLAPKHVSPRYGSKMPMPPASS